MAMALSNITWECLDFKGLPLALPLPNATRIWRRTGAFQRALVRLIRTMYYQDIRIRGWRPPWSMSWIDCCLLCFEPVLARYHSYKRANINPLMAKFFYISSKQIKQSLRIFSKVYDKIMTLSYGLCTIYTVSGIYIMHTFSIKRTLGVNISSK